MRIKFSYLINALAIRGKSLPRRDEVVLTLFYSLTYNVLRNRLILAPIYEAYVVNGRKI